MALQIGFNPFAAVEISASESLRALLGKYAKAQGGDSARQGTLGPVPFNRIIDGWLLSAALGARLVEDLPDSQSLGGKTFITGQVVQNDIATIEFMMLLAISISGDAYIVEDPKAMIKHLRNAAEAGLPFLEELLTKGNQTELVNLTKGLLDLLNPQDSIAEA